MNTFAGNPAPGVDPNAAMSSLPEAGTMVLGTDTTTQKGFCAQCQNLNTLKLSDKKRNYQPGSPAPVSAPDAPANGKGNK
jgi:hypothetical protein